MADRPNVLVVMCDRMRRSATSCAENPDIETHNIDRLSEQGARFTNASSTYPVCVPSRFTFMTGAYAHTRSVPHIDWQMSPTERTIAHELNEAGYRTAYIGKWHLAGVRRFTRNEAFDIEEVKRKTGYTHVRRELQGGFQHWMGFELRNDHFDTVYFENDDPTPRPVGGFETDGLFDLARETIESKLEEPFFLVVSVTPPHPPFTAPESDLDRWRGRDLHLRPNTDEDAMEMLIDDLRAYYAAIENVDRNLGRLVSFLESEGIREDTAVLFLSDHGEMFGSHGTRLTSGRYPYEESVGIPFVVSCPFLGIDDGRTIDEPTCSEDWYPTIRGLAGLDPDDSKPGADLTPLLRGERDTLDRPGVMLEWVRTASSNGPFSGEAWRGFRTEQYKYTVRGGPYGCEPWQLFDLEEDPYDLENLINDADYEDVAERLHGQLRARMDATNDRCPLRPALGHDALNAWWETCERIGKTPRNGPAE